MEMKLGNGVRVSILDEEGQKVVKFDQPVRVIELDLREASHIGASLYRSKRITLLPYLLNLAESGFFATPRTFGEVKSKLSQLNIKATSGAVTMCLVALVNKRLLSRTGKRRNYAYESAM
jgi:hypothetical protein